MADPVGGRRQVDEDVVALDLNREPPELVGELVERPARPQVEARVVPVAGEDPVADGAPVEREAHVRAAVVDGVDLVALGEEAEGLVPDVDDETSGGAQLGERGGADEAVGGDCGHGVSLSR